MYLSTCIHCCTVNVSTSYAGSDEYVLDKCVWDWEAAESSGQFTVQSNHTVVSFHKRVKSQRRGKLRNVVLMSKDCIIVRQ